MARKIDKLYSASLHRAFRCHLGSALILLRSGLGLPIGKFGEFLTKVICPQQWLGIISSHFYFYYCYLEKLGFDISCEMSSPELSP